MSSKRSLIRATIMFKPGEKMYLYLNKINLKTVDGNLSLTDISYFRRLKPNIASFRIKRMLSISLFNRIGTLNNIPSEMIKLSLPCLCPRESAYMQFAHMFKLHI